MPHYRVRGVLTWTEEMEEDIDMEVWAESEEDALYVAAQDSYGVILGDDLMHQFSSFTDDTEVTEVKDDE